MIENSLKAIFDNHPTASYVTIIRQIQNLDSEVVILRANVGMIPPGKKDIDPDRNAIQCLAAQTKNEIWQIISFQNTPAQFHGQPYLTADLNKELRALLY